MKTKPNILLIMTDQHRAGLMTCAGNSLVPTPNIDYIAEQGVRFSNAYCPYPVCLASRSSMLTGLYAHTTGAINNSDLLDWRYKTIAHHLSENGYLTGLIGKMHFNDANNHGFQYYLSINDWLMYLGPKVKQYANEIANHPLDTHFFDTMIDDGAGFPDVANLWNKDSPWVNNVQQFDFLNMSSTMNTEDHLDSFIARETNKFLHKYHNQPFFLVCSFMKPHTPLFPPKEFAENYPVEQEELPSIDDITKYPKHIQEMIKRFQLKDKNLQKAHRAGYHGNLEFVDSCVGKVSDTLDSLSLWDNTIVVYTSDHGEMDGDHGLYQKFCLFDPSVKVPLIVCYKDKIPKGVVADALTEQIGLYPTLLDLADLPKPTNTFIIPSEDKPEKMDGKSFANIAINPTFSGPDSVYSENNLKGTPQQFMIRTKQYKFIQNIGCMDELYDILNDSGEKINLINNSAYNDVIKNMRDLLENKITNFEKIIK